MKAEDIDKLTLGELRQIADRALDALQRFKRVRAVMVNTDEAGDVGPDPELDEIAADPPPKSKKGKSNGKRPPIDEDAAAAHRRRQFQPVEDPRPRALAVQTDPRAKLSAAERAEKERILRGRVPVDPNLPEDMQRMEAGE